VSPAAHDDACHHTNPIPEIERSAATMTSTLHPADSRRRRPAVLHTVVTIVAVLATVASVVTGPADPAGARAEAVDATTSASPEAALRPVLTGVRAVATGSFHSCALMATRRVRCWGHNEAGTLGDGTRTGRPAAVLVRNTMGTGPLTGVTAIAAGLLHTCALLTNQELRCWGDNTYGQLGRGSTEVRALVPGAVANESGESRLQGVTQVTAGERTTCARLVSGQVRCWGDNLDHELGNGGTSPSSLPTPVSSVIGGGPLTGVTQVDSGDRHTCARLATGRAVCWGANDDGMLGDGTTPVRTRPVEVVNGGGIGPLTGVRRVTAGGRFSCAELVNGTARCWGDGRYGEIGDGQTADRLLPTIVRRRPGGGPLRGITQLQAGYGHACARLTNGQAWCWGDNSAGQLGNGIPAGPDVASPRPVRNVTGPTALTRVAQVRTSASHTCVVLAGGRALCWGYGVDGQLGNGARSTRNRPVAVRLAVA
jgi:alpha-tubulin suppressor-like RCC1 family protein